MDSINITNSVVMLKDKGLADVLKVTQQEESWVLASGEVVVKAHYSGINFADVVMRLGMYQDAPPYPFIPGYEISGEITHVGSDVTDLKVGDKVMAFTKFGGYAHHHKLHRRQVIKLAEGQDLESSVALPVNFITAHIALNEFARVRPGDKILLDGASGGVGIMAMGIARENGAEVVGLTSSPNKKEFIESFGAKAMTHEEFANSDEKGFTFILNSSGGKAVKQQYKRLAMGGEICCIGLQSSIQDGKTSLFKRLKSIFSTPIYPLVMLVLQSKRVGGFNALKFFEDDAWVEKNMPVLASTQIKPHIGKVFDANQVAEAHNFLESRKAKGKVLIKWN